MIAIICCPIRKLERGSLISVKLLMLFDVVGWVQISQKGSLISVYIKIGVRRES